MASPVLVANQVVVKVGERREDVAYTLEGLKAGDGGGLQLAGRLSNGSHVEVIEISASGQASQEPDAELSRP